MTPLVRAVLMAIALSQVIGKVHGIYKIPMLTGEGVCETTFTRNVVYTAYEQRGRYICDPYNKNCRVFYYIVTVKKYRTEQVVTPVCCKGFYEEDDSCIRNVTVIAPVTPNSRAADVSSTSPTSPAVVGLSMVLVVVFIAIGIAVFLKYRDKARIYKKKRLNSSPTSTPRSPDPMYVEPNKSIPVYLDLDAQNNMAGKAGINHGAYERKIAQRSDSSREEPMYDDYDEVETGKVSQIRRVFTTKISQFTASLREAHGRLKIHLQQTEGDLQSSGTIRRGKRLPSVPKIPDNARSRTLKRDRSSVGEFHMTQNTAYGVKDQFDEGSDGSLSAIMMKRSLAKENKYAEFNNTNFEQNDSDEAVMRQKDKQTEKPPDYDEANMYSSYASISSMDREYDTENQASTDKEHI